MNKFLGVALLGAVLSLSACGGDSDSSGSDAVIRPTPPVTPPALAVCPSTGTSPGIVMVTVPNNASCTYSIPNVNSGATQTYKCTNGTLSSGGITSGGGIIINKYEIRCAV